MTEVEKKAIISPEQASELGKKILTAGGNDLGENNTESTFFIDDSTQLKVTRNITKNTAKISWKSGSMGASHAVEEIEIPVANTDYENVIRLFEQSLKGLEKYVTQQQRHDYELRGVSASIKYSEDWGHHVELDVTIENPDKTDHALQMINEVAHQLEIKLMTQEEEAAYVKQMIERRKSLSP